MVDFATAVDQGTDTPATVNKTATPMDFATAVEQSFPPSGGPQALAQSREAFMSAQIGQPLGEPGTLPFMDRADLGLSFSFEDKKAKFLDKYPSGDFISVNEPPMQVGASSMIEGLGGKSILFRRNPNEPFAELDPPMARKFELMGDIADMSGEIPSAAAQTIIMRGGNLVNQMLRAFGGSVIGDTALKTIEAARGFNKETFGQNAEDVLTRGIGATGGTAATIAVSGPINILRGAATIKLMPGATEAQAAAARLGMPSLLPSQIARSPVLRKMNEQAASISSGIGQYMEDQNKAVVNAMLSLSDKDNAALLGSKFAELQNNAKDQILTAAKLNPTGLSEAGGAIQRGILIYDDISRATVNRAYDEARKIATPTYDLSTARAVADQLERGIPVAERPQLWTQPNTINAAAPLDPRLQSIIDKIRKIDPNGGDITIGDQTYTATDALRALRSQLWDLKTPAAGEIARQENYQAGKLYSALTNVLENPTNADPAFREAWARAAGLASSRFDTMEKLLIVQASKTETPAQLANRLAQPVQVDNLRLLKSVIPAAQFQTFRDAVKTDWLSTGKINGLSKRLDSFDRETLNEIFTSAEQSHLRIIGQNMNVLNDVGIQKILDTHSNVGNMIGSLADQKATVPIDNFVKMVQASSPEIQASVRAALVQHIFERASQTIPNTTDLAINAKAIRSIVSDYADKGLMKLLTQNDVRVINDVTKVIPFVPQSADFGTSLMRAQMVSGLSQVVAPERGGHAFRNAVITFLQERLLGNIFTSKLFQRMTLGAGKSPLQFSNLRVMGGVLAQTAQELQHERDVAKQGTGLQ